MASPVKGFLSANSILKSKVAEEYKDKVFSRSLSDIENDVVVAPVPLKDIEQLPDAATNWVFTALFPSLPNILPNNDGTMNDVSQGEVLKARILKFRYNPISINTKDIKFQSRSIKIPEGISTSDVDLTLYEDYNYTCYRYFQHWLDTIVSPDGTFGLPLGDNGYMRNIDIIIYDYAGKPKFKVALMGVYPTKVSDFSYDKQQASTLTLNVTLATVQVVATKLFTSEK